jgi:hypothetical protein
LFCATLTLPDISNPESFEDVVNLLVPELQKRGIYWNDYSVPGGTLRENVHSAPGESLLKLTHAGAKVRWNAPKETETKNADVVVAVAEESPTEAKVAT